jgi:hypothetical protein
MQECTILQRNEILAHWDELMSDMLSSSICNLPDLCSLLDSSSVSRRLLDDLCRVACHNRVRSNILGWI